MDSGCVGFANLPNQVHRKSVKKGFQLNIMLVGQRGLGKSTLVNSLFLTDLNLASENYDESTGVCLLENSVVIEEKAVKLKLSVVNAQGFGDAIDNSQCTEPIVNYIQNQFHKYFDQQSGLNRRNICDTRVHCLFYFIAPWQKGLKPLDLWFLSQIHDKVNVVPIIAKADTLTSEELAVLKSAVNHDITEHALSIYTVPDDDDCQELNAQLQAAIPYAACGSQTFSEHGAGGRKFRARVYPWGTVDVENPKCSDFRLIRSLIINHMHDLQEITHEVHYENFRAMHLKEKSLLGAQGASRMSGDASIYTELSDEQDMIQIVRQKEMELQRMREEMARLKVGK